ncbi:hypothetical protein [Krasilnikovia cinnamomea]|nr:hypothetical protein [Krasilnikovia cinnamomea]
MDATERPRMIMTVISTGGLLGDGRGRTTAGLLTDQDGVAGFGHEHRWLPYLRGGWQLLETTGFSDPPDLLQPCEAGAATTGHPVLAAYISDIHCAVMCAADPGRVGALTHLWDVAGPCGVFRHQPADVPAPLGRSIDDVVTELVAW